MVVVCGVGVLYLIAIFARILLSWFPLNPDGVMATIGGFLYMITDPVLAPLRRIIPPLRLGNIALDLSAIVVIIGLNVILSILGCL
jgi:YggT family protein